MSKWKDYSFTLLERGAGATCSQDIKNDFFRVSTFQVFWGIFAFLLWRTKTVSPPPGKIPSDVHMSFFQVLGNVSKYQTYIIRQISDKKFVKTNLLKELFFVCLLKLPNQTNKQQLCLSTLCLFYRSCLTKIYKLLV